MSRLLAVLIAFSTFAFAACGGSDGNTPAADGGAVLSDCPNGFSVRTVAGVSLCERPPTLEAQGYDEGTDTTTCGDPVPALDTSCFTTRPTAPALPATVTLEGYIDTFGLEKSTTGVTVEVRTPTGTVLGTVLGDANHRCSRVKVVGTKTSTLVGYTIPNIPTNQLVVVKNTGSGFKPTWNFGKHFDTNDCVNAQTITDDTCHSGCFIRNGQYVMRYDTNAISDQTWTLIPLTAGYSRGIGPGNAALAGQLHDCKNNQLRNASVAFSPSAKAKLATYFNGNCEDPTPNNALQFSNKDSLYALLDATPGAIKISGDALVGGVMVNLGVFDIELYANSVSLLTVGPPLPRVLGADGGL